MIETTIYTRLTNYAGLTALVGTRIYPLILPQGVTYPAVTYQRISTLPRESCMVSDVGIAREHLQVTAWDETYASVKAIVDQIRKALQRWTTSGIQGTFIIGEYDLYDETALRYGAAIEAEVIYEEV